MRIGHPSHTQAHDRPFENSSHQLLTLTSAFYIMLSHNTRLWPGGMILV